MIGINGAAAHLIHEGDLVILITYAQASDVEARAMRPKVVHVDARNRIVRIGSDPAEALADSERLTLRGDADYDELLRR